jgi:hypothetical protein
MLATCVSAEISPALSASTADTWPGTELFTEGHVCRVKIEIGAIDLDQLRKESRTFVRAKIEESTNVYSNVAVHLKGSVGSFRSVDDKPAWTLDFNRFSPGQRFHGLRRIHLNNSVEDSTYCNEQLGGELFRSAGIPAPRAGHALVTLNGRRLGLYVLQEGFTEDFLSCYFKHLSGNLFEPGEGHDVNEHLKRMSLPGPVPGRAQLKALGQAALDHDPDRAWQRLPSTLEVDRFIRFMALEIMLCHRDGYCLARNNFKLYEDVDTRKLIFLPQGMDQLFRPAELPWHPHMAGLVARAVCQAPEGNERYTQEFRHLFETLFQLEALTNRVALIIAALQDSTEPAEFRKIQAEAAALQQRIVERHRWLAEQLSQAQLEPLQLRDGTATLIGWTEADVPPGGSVDQVMGPNGVRCLHLQTGSQGFPSWRTKARLAPGHYRFEAKGCTSKVLPLGFGTHQGAGLRLAGRPLQSESLVGTSSWRKLSCDFEVSGGSQEEQFICELRAKSGEAWFESDSLKVTRVK